MHAPAGTDVPELMSQPAKHNAYTCPNCETHWDRAQLICPNCGAPWASSGHSFHVAASVLKILSAVALAVCGLPVGMAGACFVLMGLWPGPTGTPGVSGYSWMNLYYALVGFAFLVFSAGCGRTLFRLYRSRE